MNNVSTEWKLNQYRIILIIQEIIKNCSIFQEKKIHTLTRIRRLKKI